MIYEQTKVDNSKYVNQTGLLLLKLIVKCYCVNSKSKCLWIWVLFYSPIKVKFIEWKFKLVKLVCINDRKYN